MVEPDRLLGCRESCEMSRIHLESSHSLANGAKLGHGLDGVELLDRFGYDVVAPELVETGTRELGVVADISEKLLLQRPERANQVADLAIERIAHQTVAEH